jgi:hypothetical protein
MRKQIGFSLFLCGIFFLSANSNAQSSHFSMYGGLGIPTYEFGEKLNGGATAGINLGLKYQLPISNNGFDITAAIEYNYEGLQSATKDYLHQSLEQESGMSMTVDYFHYSNIPITGGINYTSPANGNFAFWSEFAAGIDFLKVSDMNLYTNYGEIIAHFDLSAKICYKLGAGLLYKDKYLLGVNYWWMGKHSAHMTLESGSAEQDAGEMLLNVSLITTTIGYRF